MLVELHGLVFLGAGVEASTDAFDEVLRRHAG